MAGLSEMIALAEAMQARQATQNRQKTPQMALGETLSAGSAQFMPGMELGIKRRKEQEEMKLKQAENFINAAKFIREQEKFKMEQEAVQRELAYQKQLDDKYNQANFQSALSSDMPTGNRNADKSNRVYNKYKSTWKMTSKGRELTEEEVLPTEGKGDAKTTEQSRLIRQSVRAEARRMAEGLYVDMIDEMIASGDEDKILRATYLQGNSAPQSLVDELIPVAQIALVDGDEPRAKSEMTKIRIKTGMLYNKYNAANPVKNKRELKEQTNIKGTGLFDIFKKKKKEPIENEKLPATIKTTSQALKYYMDKGLSKEDAIKKIREENK